MGHWHADAIRRIGERVAYVVDQDIGRAELLAARCAPQTRPARQLQDVSPGKSIDVVHVCTPLETHEMLIRQGLEAGCHVLCEKPLAETAEVTAELVSLAAARGRVLCVTHQFLFQDGMQRAFAALPRIGPLLHVDLVACSAGAVGTFANRTDALIPEVLPHPLAIIARMFPGALADADWLVQHPRVGELRAMAQVDRTSIALLVSAHGRPTLNWLRVIGERGTLEVDLFHGYLVLERGAVSRLHKIAHPFTRSGKTLVAASTNLARRAARREVAYPGLRELTRRFYAAARGQAAPPLSAREIIDVARGQRALTACLG